LSNSLKESLQGAVVPDEEQRGDSNPKPKRSVTPKRKFSQGERFWITVLPILGSVGLVAARLIYESHLTLSIWLFLASALIYDSFLWIFLKGLFHHRTTVAVLLALIAVIGFGAWDQASVPPPPKITFPPAPPSSIDLRAPVTQNGGPCTANVIGSGNTISNCSPAPQKERKQ
jgi:hypothetical protein